MKIAICGHLKFAEDMKRIKSELEQKGHSVDLPIKVDGTDYNNKSVSKGANNIIEYDLIKEHYKKIINSDAILVINPGKNNIKDYIGGNSFLEMGFAHVTDKKIFILNDLPIGLNYCEEIIGMQPTILNGDLNKIK